MSNFDVTDDMRHIHQYLGENVRFADAKAAVVSAWTGGTIAWLISRIAELLKGGPIAGPAWLVCGVALLILAGSFFFSIMVITPVLKSKNDGGGFVFWGDILRLGKADFKKKILTATAEDAREQLALHIFQLAEICSTKFARVRIAIFGAVVGTALTGLTLFL